MHKHTPMESVYINLHGLVITVRDKYISHGSRIIYVLEKLYNIIV